MFYVQNISTYEFQGEGGDVHGPQYIFCLLLKKRKKYKSMTYTKIKFYIIFIDIFFLWWIIKNLGKGGPKISEKGGARRRYNWATMSRVAPCDTPHTVWIISLPLRKEGTLSQKYYAFFYYSFPNIYFFYTSKDYSPTVFIMEWWDSAFCSGITPLQKYFFRFFELFYLKFLKQYCI